MARLLAKYKIADVVVNNTTAALFAIDAPTNQKVVVSVNIFGKDATNGSMVDVELRRRGTDDGTKSAAVTWVKVNPLDTETVQTEGYTYSAQPTNDGTAVRNGSVGSGRNLPIPAFTIEGGGLYSVFVKTTANVTLQGEVLIEE